MRAALAHEKGAYRLPTRPNTRMSALFKRALDLKGAESDGWGLESSSSLEEIVSVGVGMPGFAWVPGLFAPPDVRERGPDGPHLPAGGG